MSLGLNNAEIDSLAVLAATGDKSAMTELVNIMTPLARSKARKLNSEATRLPNDDLVQEVLIGLLVSLKNFDISKGIPFKAYAMLCIENRMISALKRNSNSGNSALSSAVSLEDELTGLSGSDPEEKLLSDEGAEEIYSFIESVLSDFEQSVLQLRFRDMSYKQISVIKGCSEKAVDNAMCRIRKKIRSFNK